MPSIYKHPVLVGTIVLSLIAGISMLVFRFSGYDSSIGWSVTAETDLDELVTYEVKKGPFDLKIVGDKVTVIESYFGDVIQPMDTISIVYFIGFLTGLAILFAAATYLKRWGYLSPRRLELKVISRSNCKRASLPAHSPL